MQLLAASKCKCNSCLSTIHVSSELVMIAIRSTWSKAAVPVVIESV